MTTSLNLRAIGWKPFFEQQLSLDHSRASFVARVSAHHGSQIILLGAQGEFSIPTQLAGSIDEIAVGDWLVLDAADHRALDRLQRQTLLSRKASSGVGKTTLANALGVGGLVTGEIREQDGKGRHITTARSLHLLPSGGVLVDNPGMRELQLPACEQGVTDLFDDVLQIAALCRFKNCSHEGDAGCAVTAAVDSGELNQRRFNNFQKLLAEQAHNSRSLADRRDRDRKTGKLYKSIISDKRRRRDET